MSELIVIESTQSEDFEFNDPLNTILTDFSHDLGYSQVAIPHEEAASRRQQIQAALAVIIPGVPFIYPIEKAEDLVPSLESWIYDIKVPVLGICLGHQALGLAFGAEMLRNNEEVEVGSTIAEVAKDHAEDPLFKNLERRFEIASLHWAAISIQNSVRISRLASSRPKKDVSETGCKNQIIQINGTDIYGTQFHPENTEDGKILLKNFLKLSQNKSS